MQVKNQKIRRMAAALILAVLLLALLGAAAVPRRAISAEYCYLRNAPAVLYLRSYYESGSLKATGSGFVISEDGLLITAAHVVKGGDRFTAVREDGSEQELKLLSQNDAADVAVLRLPEGKYAHVTLAGAPPNSGARLWAIGFPAKGTRIITEGIVSAPCAEVSGENKMMVTCDIVSGMSGGPIFDVYGHVVGVVSGSLRTMDGIHLSVLSEELYQAAQAAMKTTEAGE